MFVYTLNKPTKLHQKLIKVKWEIDRPKTVPTYKRHDYLCKKCQVIHKKLPKLVGDFSKAKQGEFAKIPGKIDTNKITLKFICKGRGTITAKTVLKKKKLS